MVVSRQNGKTELLVPRIVMGLRMGRRMIHTAQNRFIPRETFLRIAAQLMGDPLVSEVRYANGQEVIKYANGGRYTLVAPNPNVRGNAVDDVFIDEVREQRDFELIAALKPTLTASKNPQIVYLSNAGDAGSVVLNDLRQRAENDQTLAYLEWSADPVYPIDDRRGWAQANPALGITIQQDTLEDFYASLPAAEWETEHLCRWVVSMRPRLIDESAWLRAKGHLERPVRPSMAVSVDPSGSRASAAIAWRQSDGTIGLKVVADVHGEPVNIDALGPDLAQRAMRMGATVVGFDPWTDTELARHFRNAEGRQRPRVRRRLPRLRLRGRGPAPALGRCRGSFSRPAVGRAQAARLGRLHGRQGPGRQADHGGSRRHQGSRARARRRRAAARLLRGMTWDLRDGLRLAGRAGHAVQQRTSIEDLVGRIQPLRTSPWRMAGQREALGVPAVFKAVSPHQQHRRQPVSMEGYRGGAKLPADDTPRLVIRPNPRTRPHQFWRDSAFNLARLGEAWWWTAKRDSDGSAMSLIPVDPREITVEQNPRNELQPGRSAGARRACPTTT